MINILACSGCTCDLIQCGLQECYHASSCCSPECCPATEGGGNSMLLVPLVPQFLTAQPQAVALFHKAVMYFRYLLPAAHVGSLYAVVHLHLQTAVLQVAGLRDTVLGLGFLNLRLAHPLLDGTYLADIFLMGHHTAPPSSQPATPIVANTAKRPAKAFSTSPLVNDSPRSVAQREVNATFRLPSQARQSEACGKIFRSLRNTCQ